MFWFCCYNPPQPPTNLHLSWQPMCNMPDPPSAFTHINARVQAAGGWLGTGIVILDLQPAVFVKIFSSDTHCRCLPLDLQHLKAHSISSGPPPYACERPLFCSLISVELCSTEIQLEQLNLLLRAPPKLKSFTCKPMQACSKSQPNTVPPDISCCVQSST